jgi:hypothetical protein
MEHGVCCKRHETETDLAIGGSAEKEKRLASEPTGCQRRSDQGTATETNRDVSGKFAQFMGMGLGTYMNPLKI